MKALKWVVIIVGCLVVLVIAVLLIAPMFIDIQTYKPRIEEQVAKSTGRAFTIGGELKLSLFPWAGIAFSDLHLGNPKGFKEKDFVSVKSFDVKVKLLPLISRDIQVKRFVVVGPRIVLERDKTGRGNWEGLGKPSKEVSPKKAGKPEKGPMEGLPIKGLAVGEFAVKDGGVLWIDHAAGERREIRDLTLELRDVSLDRPVQMALSARMDGKPLTVEGKVGPLGKEPGKGKIPLDLSVRALDQLTLTLKGEIEDAVTRPRFDLTLQVSPFSPRKLVGALGRDFPVSTADPEALTSVALKARVKGDPQNVSLSEGALDLDQSKITFSAGARDFSKPDLKFKVNLDQIDVDRYLPPPAEKKAGEGEKKAAAPKEKTDYGPLRKPVLDGEIRVGEVRIKGARLQALVLKVKARNGVYNIDPFGFKAYQGDLSTRTTLDVRGDVPRTGVDLEGKDFQVQPLLKDLMNKDFLAGSTYAKVALRMEGDDADMIKKTLNGDGDLRFNDGAIVGIDLPGMVRNLKTSFGLAEKTGERPKTDFSEFQIPFTIKDGLAKTPGTRLVSPLLRVLAAGKADLVKETLDFRVEPKFVGTLKGQGDTKDRAGLSVPVLVGGTFTSPTFRPDLEGMLKKTLEKGIPKPEELKDTLKEIIPKEGDEGSVKEAVKGLLKGLPFGQ
jgi:AsmA protein